MDRASRAPSGSRAAGPLRVGTARSPGPAGQAEVARPEHLANSQPLCLSTGCLSPPLAPCRPHMPKQAEGDREDPGGCRQGRQATRPRRGARASSPCRPGPGDSGSVGASPGSSSGLLGPPPGRDSQGLRRGSQVRPPVQEPHEHSQPTVCGAWTRGPKVRSGWCRRPGWGAAQGSSHPCILTEGTVLIPRSGVCPWVVAELGTVGASMSSRGLDLAL